MLPGFGRLLSPWVYTRDLMMLKELRVRIYGVIYIFHSFQLEVRQVRGPLRDWLWRPIRSASSGCGGVLLWQSLVVVGLRAGCVSLTTVCDQQESQGGWPDSG
jgi:hypothetical protein